MTYVITQNCCNDASCLAACPVGCIHPTPDEPDFATTEMLYVDPATCIDCGACADWCPVDAIKPHTELTLEQQPYLEMSADYYRQRPTGARWQYVPLEPLITIGRSPLKVAIVGAGPAAWYCAQELLEQPGVEVSMFDRLPAPFGLVRYGVAPDHPATKKVVEQFRFDRDQQARFQMFLNVEVGEHVSHNEIASHHHAVIYAYGASADRRLHIAGEDLPGSIPATRLVAWYNGHPDHADLEPPLDTRRAVIVGNGNVALDIARILVADPDELAHTDIADPALDILRRSDIDEVVILGRRSAADAAFTTPELLALTQLAEVDVMIDVPDLRAQLTVDHDTTVRRKIELLSRLATADDHGESGRKRIVLRFNTAPVEIIGRDRVEGVVAAPTTIVEDEPGNRRAVIGTGYETIETGLVIRSVGFHGTAIPGVPFDTDTGTVPNVGGRVLANDAGPMAGVYTSGWIKRGPSGVIGTNRLCAKETVSAIFEDFINGRLAEPAAASLPMTKLIHQQRPEAIDRRAWERIDTAEIQAGKRESRPRRKLVTTAQLLSAAKRPPIRQRLPLLSRRSS